jgi:hypothetical protein
MEHWRRQDIERGIELSIQRVDKGDEIPAALAAAKASGAGAAIEHEWYGEPSDYLLH